MRKVHVNFPRAYLEPSAEYAKIVRASEKAASNVQKLIDSGLYSFASFKILCSDYRSMKKAAEKMFKKIATGGEYDAKAKKEYQRALRVIGDALDGQLAYYASGVVRNRADEVEKIGRDMKKGIYAGHLPSSGYVNRLMDDINGVREELEKAGISSRGVSKSVDSNVKKAEKIREQLERYTSKLSK